MCEVQDLTVIKIDLCDGIECINFHTGKATAQHPISDTGTKIYMTLPVHEQRSTPA